MKMILGVLLFFVFVSADAALISRLGDQAVYDTDLDITWLTDANLAASNTFGLSTGVLLGTYPGDTSGVSGLINANGTMNWPGALIWIDAMNTANYLGFNDWRLPITPQPDPTCSNPGATGFDCTGSEMGHLFNVDGVIWSTAPGPFSNFVPDGFTGADYWSGTGFDRFNAWRFIFNNGLQATFTKGNALKAFAVRSGDVAAVPVPAAVWLFGSALGLLGWMRRKKA